jgi:phosphatidylglycerophosphate synthase
MLDGWMRGKLDPALDAMAVPLARAGVSANAITVAACLVGLGAAVAIAFGAPLLGFVLLLVSRIGDGLDGAVAKVNGRTDLGGYLDIVFDFVFYGAIPLGFAVLDPAANALAAGVLVLAFYVNGASFLAYAALAEKRGMATDARGPKSLYFTTGLAEATETIAVFALSCLLPAWFPVLAYAFAAVTVVTTCSRIALAVRVFG